MSKSRTELDRNITLETNYRREKWLSLEEFSLPYVWFCSGLASLREASEPRAEGERHVFVHSASSYLTAKCKAGPTHALLMEAQALTFFMSFNLLLKKCFSKLLEEWWNISPSLWGFVFIPVSGLLGCITAVASCKDLLLEVGSVPSSRTSGGQMPRTAPVRATQRWRVSTPLGISNAEFNPLLFQAYLMLCKYFLSGMETETASPQLIQRNSPQINQTNGEENQ